MIARIKILLSFYFSLRVGDELLPHEFNLGPYAVKIYPPYQTVLDLTNFAELAEPTRSTLERLKLEEPPSEPT